MVAIQDLDRAVERTTMVTQMGLASARDIAARKDMAVCRAVHIPLGTYGFIQSMARFWSSLEAWMGIRGRSYWD